MRKYFTRKKPVPIMANKRYVVVPKEQPRPPAHRTLALDHFTIKVLVRAVTNTRVPGFRVL